MTTLHREIAKIRSASLGFEDHGVLTTMIQLDYGCLSQTIGTYCLSSVDEPDKPAVAIPRAMDFIIRVLRACGVDRWEQLPGRTIFTLWSGDHMPLNTMPVGIENLPTEKGERFLFAEWQDAVKREQEER